MLRGIPVSSGYGMGTAWVIAEPEPTKAARAWDIQSEQARIRHAAEIYQGYLTSLAGRLHVYGTEKTEFLVRAARCQFTAELVERMCDMISDGMSAEQAVSRVCDQCVQSRYPDDTLSGWTGSVGELRENLLLLLDAEQRQEMPHIPPNTVLTGRNVNLSVFAQIDISHIAGIVLETTIGEDWLCVCLARALEIPMVMGVKGILDVVSNGDTLIADGCEGAVTVCPDEDTSREYCLLRESFQREMQSLKPYRSRPGKTADGRKIPVFSTIDGFPDFQAAHQAGAEGIGLLRTEALFPMGGKLPDEDAQFAVYRKAVMSLPDKPMILRIADMSGDGDRMGNSAIIGYGASSDLCGIRFALSHPELFRAQLRAVLRAAQYADIRILLPTVSCVKEIHAAKRMLAEEAEALQVRMIPVGAMIETAAAAIDADILAREADFFSVETDGLTRHIMGVGHADTDTAYLYSALYPAVLRSIRRAAVCAHEAGIPVGICGKAAEDAAFAALVIAFRFDRISVSTGRLLCVRKALSQWDTSEADMLAEEVLSCTSVSRTRALLERAQK